jgi:Fic family protein
LLQAVRQEGDWEGWLAFFAQAVKETADQCAATAQRMNELARADRVRIQGLGRIAGSATIVHQELLKVPLTTIARITKATGLVPNTVRKVFAAMAEAGIVREITGKRRNRLFAYKELIDTMDEGTRPSSARLR